MCSKKHQACKSYTIITKGKVNRCKQNFAIKVNAAYHMLIYQTRFTIKDRSNNKRVEMKCRKGVETIKSKDYPTIIRSDTDNDRRKL